jgi:hypothetical protein
MFGKKKSEGTSQPSTTPVKIEFQLTTENMLAPKHVVEVTMNSHEVNDLDRLREKAAWAENRNPNQVEVTKWWTRG